MKVFLSWSGPVSKHVACTLRDWLPLVLQAVKPWISVDIEKGQKWNDELSKALKLSKVCILCITKDNTQSQYLHYEAGAISSNENSRNCTFLFNVKEKEVTNPLSSFQNTKFDKEDVYRLISDINSLLGENDEVNLKESLLRKNFDLHWPELETQLKDAPKPEKEVPERDDSDVLSEILQIVRGLKKPLSNETTSRTYISSGMTNLFPTEKITVKEDILASRSEIINLMKWFLDFQDIKLSDAIHHIPYLHKQITKKLGDIPLSVITQLAENIAHL